MPYEIRRRVIPHKIVDAALRVINLDLLTNGIDPRWPWQTSWFPHLRDHEAVLALTDFLPPVWREGEMAGPQILLHFPDPPDRELSWHTDGDLPEGVAYSSIVGVPLTRWTQRNGTLVVQDDGLPFHVELDVSDVVRMDPDALHSSGVNKTGAVRYGVYFRWLTDAR